MKNLDLSVVEVLSIIRYRILANVHMPIKFEDLSKDDYLEFHSAHLDTCNLLSALIDLLKVQDKYADHD